jgi:hypothetical protein
MEKTERGNNMPEYLAPGVYAEETEIVPIEGLRVSVANFADFERKFEISLEKEV